MLNEEKLNQTILEMAKKQTKEKQLSIEVLSLNQQKFSNNNINCSLNLCFYPFPSEMPNDQKLLKKLTIYKRIKVIITGPDNEQMKKSLIKGIQLHCNDPVDVIMRVYNYKSTPQKLWPIIVTLEPYYFTLEDAFQIIKKNQELKMSAQFAKYIFSYLVSAYNYVLILAKRYLIGHQKQQNRPFFFYYFQADNIIFTEDYMVKIGYPMIYGWPNYTGQNLHPDIKYDGMWVSNKIRKSLIQLLQLISEYVDGEIEKFWNKWPFQNEQKEQYLEINSQSEQMKKYLNQNRKDYMKPQDFKYFELIFSKISKPMKILIHNQNLMILKKLQNEKAQI